MVCLFSDVVKRKTNCHSGLAQLGYVYCMGGYMYVAKTLNTKTINNW